jgi:amino acid transporter
VLLILAMSGLNVAGSQAVAKVQTTVVYVVIGILTLFAAVTIVNMDPHLLAFSGYPRFRDIISSVALTFFAFLGFGVITFTAKDLEEPARQLPRAMYLALGIATIIYVAVALGVFGTLTVEKVISSGGTALAVAAEPSLGKAGYWLMSVTALFATAGATNAGLYPAPGLCEQMAAVGQFPPALGRRLGNRLPMGLVVTAALASVLALGFDLSSIASIGSAIALLVFGLDDRGVGEVLTLEQRVRERHHDILGALVVEGRWYSPGSSDRGDVPRRPCWLTGIRHRPRPLAVRAIGRLGAELIRNGRGANARRG